MNKALISARFSKNLATYNENAKIQRRMAERLMSFLDREVFESILEIGCGTGILTELVNEKIEFKSYKAIDIVEDCKSFVESISEDISFINEDVEIYLQQCDEEFDLIISNAALQWVQDFESVVKTLKKRLKPNGILLFTTFGKENLREIYHLLGKTLQYYSKIELLNIFSDMQIEIDEEIHIMAFDSPKDVLKHLQQTGVNSLDSKAWTKKDLVAFENGYKNLCSRRISLTYNPIYIQIK